MEDGLRSRICMAVATGLGLGYVPVAPGTAGALGGIILVFLCDVLGWFFGVVLVMALFVAGCHCATLAEIRLGQEDPQKVVIDEVVGMAIAMAFISISWYSIAIQFFLFRLFDIVKPFPVKQMENMFSGGLAIMMDDLMAGLMANVFFRIGSLFLS